MIDIVITAFKEPETIGKAIESFLKQELPEKTRLIVSAPDKETIDIVKKYQARDKRIMIFKDPGKGKSYALNLLLKELKGEIIVLSDGDVFVGKNSVSEILKPFADKNIGCVSGRPKSLNPRDDMLGYWSHLLVDGMHSFRMKRKLKKEFLECSGYLWAFRNNVIKKFPIDIAEDTVVPYLFREKGYRIDYAPKSEVFVKFPTSLPDFINQKKRTAKGHESLEKYVNIKKLPRTKSFKNEVVEGWWKALSHPNSIKEVFYALFLFPVRLYLWILVFWHTKIKREHYQDAWDRVETTK